MKKLIYVSFIGLFAFFASQSLHAQEYEQEFELIKSVVGKEKKDFVSSLITVPDAYSNKLWSLYNSYEEKRNVHAKQRINLISKYVDLFDEDANRKGDARYMAEVFRLRKQSDKLLKGTYKKMAKHVSSSTAMQFMQIEEYIRSAVDAKLYENLPMRH